VLLIKRLAQREELNSKLLFELLEFEVSKILGEDISSVIFSGDMIQHNLFDHYAFMHIMIFYINMFGVYFLHRVRPNENAALMICIDRDRTQSHTKFKEYSTYPAHLMGAIR
jgi:hypothetical protein